MKRNIAQKLFSILTAALLLSVLPLAAAAADEPAEPTVTLELPAKVITKQGAEVAPGKMTFGYELLCYDFDQQKYVTDARIKAVAAAVDTDGVGAVDATLKFSLPESLVVKATDAPLRLRQVEIAKEEEADDEWLGGEEQYAVIVRHGESDNDWVAVLAPVPDEGQEVAPVDVATFRNEYYAFLPTRFALPITTVVKQGGEVAPGAAEFTYEIVLQNDQKLTIDNAAVKTNGVGSTDSVLTFALGTHLTAALTDGAYLTQAKGSAEGWTYAAERYYIRPHLALEISLDTDGEPEADHSVVRGWDIYPVDENGEIDGEKPVTAAFTNTYTASKTVTPPTDPKPEPKPEPDPAPVTGVAGVAPWLVAAAGLSALGLFAAYRKTNG